MRELFTFYYKLSDGYKDKIQFRAVSYDDAISKFNHYQWKNDLLVVDFDHESEAIEEEREF